MHVLALFMNIDCFLCNDIVSSILLLHCILFCLCSIILNDLRISHLLIMIIHYLFGLFSCRLLSFHIFNEVLIRCRVFVRFFMMIFEGGLLGVKLNRDVRLFFGASLRTLA